MKKTILFICLIVLGTALNAQDVQSRPAFIQKEVAGGFLLKFGAASFGPYEEMVNPPFITSDGKGYVFTLRKNKGENWILANGKEYGPYKGEWMGDVRVADDGSSWIVTLFSKTDAGDNFSAVANGKLIPDIGGVQRAEFFPTGFFYFVTSIEKPGAREAWVITAGARFGPYDEIREILPSDDKKSISYAFMKKGANYLHIADKDLGPFDRVDTLYPDGRNGRAMGFMTEASGQSTAYIGSRQITYDRIEMFYLSPDGSQWAVKGQKGSESILNIGGKETAYKWVNWMPYDDGYLYAAQKEEGGQVTVVLNGREAGIYSEVRETFITPGGNWGLVAAKKKGANLYTLVVINGKEYDGEALRLAKTADGYQFIWLKYAENDQVMLQSLKAAK